MISVVIPAYNEENAIADVVSEIKDVVGPLTNNEFEIIVVDDCSTDNTAEVLKSLDVEVVQHLKNMGYGRSLKDGIYKAKNDTIVITDADGSYPADFIKPLYEEYKRGFAMAVAQRKGEHYRESWFKMPLRRILAKLVEFATGRRIPDVNSGLRVFSKQEILEHLPRLSNTFSFTTSVTLAYLLTFKTISYLPSEYRERVGKSKVSLFKDSLRTLQYIVQAILFYNPIKLFLALCFVAGFFAVLFFVLAIIFKSTVMVLSACIATMTALILFGLGLVADILRLLGTKQK